VGDKVQGLAGALAVITASETGPPEGNDLASDASGIHELIALQRDPHAQSRYSLASLKRTIQFMRWEQGIQAGHLGHRDGHKVAIGSTRALREVMVNELQGHSGEREHRSISKVKKQVEPDGGDGRTMP
jgi:hypothetical protein